MKKNLLIPIGLALVNLAVAQDSNAFAQNKRELNIGYFNAFELKSGTDFGIGYKYSITKGAIRLRTTFYYNYTFDLDHYINRSETETSIVKPRLGYEFHQNYNRFIVFYGVDIIGYRYLNKFNTNYLNEKLHAYTLGIGISPILGLKYFINKRISISTETNFDFMFKKTKKSRADASGSITSISDSKDVSADLSPLGVISINLHF